MDETGALKCAYMNNNVNWHSKIYEALRHDEHNYKHNEKCKAAFFLNLFVAMGIDVVIGNGIFAQTVQTSTLTRIPKVFNEDNVL